MSDTEILAIDILLFGSTGLLGLTFLVMCYYGVRAFLSDRRRRKNNVSG